jgi:Flp pilus assembly protein TadG
VLSPVAWRGLWRDRRGVAAVEFALVLPVLLLFALGAVEASRFALLGLKLQHAAETIADLASRPPTLSAAELDSLLASARPIVQPFDIGQDGVVTVSAVGADNGGPAIVVWQRQGGGGLAATSGIGAVGGGATLPADLVVRDGDTVIVAEVHFHYRGWLLQILPEARLRRVAFYRPRLGALRSLG